MPKLKQPILIIQGDLDTQVVRRTTPTSSASWRGRARRRGPVEVVHLPGVNHMLVPATTGEVKEYRSSKETDQPGDCRSTIADLAEEVAAVRESIRLCRR